MCFQLPTIPKFRSPILAFSSLFLLQLILKLTVLKVLLYCSCAADNTSAKIKLLAKENEGLEQLAVTPHDKLKNIDIPVLVFTKSTSGKIKLFQKIKKIILPTYPNFKKLPCN